MRLTPPQIWSCCAQIAIGRLTITFFNSNQLRVFSSTSGECTTAMLGWYGAGTEAPGWLPVAACQSTDPATAGDTRQPGRRLEARTPLDRLPGLPQWPAARYVQSTTTPACCQPT